VVIIGAIGFKWIILFLVYKSYRFSCSKYRPNIPLLEHYCNSVTTGTCKSIKEEVTVIPFGNTITNPVTRPTADQIVTCPNNGKDLPNIFLCGATAKH
jgi:hypothetical protein